MKRFTNLLLAVLLLVLFGCAQGDRARQTDLVDEAAAGTDDQHGARDTASAQRLTHQAAALADSDPDQAEHLLRRALAADLFHGPAHNNLGVLYLKRNPPLLYEAAEQFEWARKLMPGHPDPRMNLALTLEMAGRTDDAIATYKTALEVYPGHIQSMQALARLQLWAAAADDGTPALLREIALRGEDERWRSWARARTAGHAAAAPSAPPSSPGTTPVPAPQR
jgi:tetratricopeptide (TPR) repeat protein